MNPHPHSSYDKLQLIAPSYEWSFFIRASRLILHANPRNLTESGSGSRSLIVGRAGVFYWRPLQSTPIQFFLFIIVVVYENDEFVVVVPEN